MLCAIKMLQAAVTIKNNKALVPLEDCYCDGVIVERNYGAAVDACKRAAEEHLVCVRLQIGDYFFRRYGHEA